MTDDELIELDELLASPPFADQALNVVELQGLFCAIASGPEQIDDEVWLEFALGDLPADTAPARRARVSELMRRYCADTARGLAAGEPPLLVLADEDEAALAESYQAWAGGYLDGMELSKDEWFDHAQSDEDAQFLVRNLWPIDVLSGLAAEEAEEVGDPWPPEGTTEDDLVANAREDLAESVLALFRFWQAKHSRATN